MQIYEEILAHYLASENSQILFPQLKLDALQIAESECFRVLEKIRTILDDQTLEDNTCFEQIEQIVCALESAGIYTTRHDFG